jgi:hypothetical protein
MVWKNVVILYELYGPIVFFLISFNNTQLPKEFLKLTRKLGVQSLASVLCHDLSFVRNKVVKRFVSVLRIY